MPIRSTRVPRRRRHSPVTLTPARRAAGLRLRRASRARGAPRPHRARRTWRAPASSRSPTCSRPRALGIARRIAPLSPKLRDAGQRLDAYATQVGGRCNLSTRETVAVVLGLILGIIPGLILLVLLC